MKFRSIPFLAGVTPSGGGGGGALSVVNTAVDEAFGSVMTATIPAVGSGNSLVVMTYNPNIEITVDGGVEDASIAGLSGAYHHFFTIENITDSRTSVTIRSFVSGTPSGTLLNFFIAEVDASAIMPVSTVQVEGPGSGNTISVGYTTTVADALALAQAAYDNGPTVTTGTSGAVAVDQPSGYGALLYHESVGATGAKTLTGTMSATRSRSTAVLAYAAG